MLYLARINKKGLFGNAELQLLAQQQSHQKANQSWVPVKGNELVVSGEANAYNIGVLVLVEVNEERQVLQVEEATAKLVELLATLSSAQGFTSLGEIEQWRQSLTRQSQELSRRVAEIEARQEQLQQWETNLRKRQSS